MRILNKKRGVSTLPTMLLLGGIVIEIAIAIVFLTYYFNILNFGARLTAEALEVARAGADDAIIRVVLDKDFSNQGGYVVDLGNRSANVTVCKDVCIGVGKTEIVSTANVLNRQRRMRAVLSVDSITGQVSIDSIEEIVL